MSEENVEVVRNIYAGLNRFGPAAMLSLSDPIRRKVFDQSFDPELEIRQSPDLVFDTAGTFRGYEGFLDATRELVEALGNLRFELGQDFSGGDKVVFDLRALATGSASGVPVELRLAHLWQLKHGLVRRWIVYPTLSEALEAAGLREAPDVVDRGR